MLCVVFVVRITKTTCKKAGLPKVVFLGFRFLNKPKIWKSPKYLEFLKVF